jgi:purine-nucleoside phosphorylase
VFGSGLSDAASSISTETILNYDEIPGWPVSSVEGHPGRLVLGQVSGKDVLAMEGRVHFLEGYPMEVITFPVRVMSCLGIQILILTNSAGGLSAKLEAGDFMLISDHINLLGITGWDPLRGPNDSAFGTRYPDMSAVYDMELRQITRDAALKIGISLKEGIYICQLGPSYSTPADLNLLRMFGADAVGMSTVPEAIVACHAGMRVLGLSCITDTDVAPMHEKVLKSAGEMSAKLGLLISEVMDRITLSQKKHP